MRTFLFGSEMGSSLSHFWKGLAAKEEGRFWPSHAFGVVVPTSSEDGSNVGELGGGGLPELRMSAAWIGLTEGLEAEGPVVSVLLGSSPVQVADGAEPVGCAVGSVLAVYLGQLIL